MNIVVMISADAEWSVIKPLFSEAAVQGSPYGEWFDAQVGGWPVRFFHGGWGKISAAAATQYAIDHFSPDLLINLGTCGGFQGRIEQGTTILVERTIVYDIVEQMTDPDEAIEHYSTQLDLSWLPRVNPSPVSRGLLVSADRDILLEDIPMLIQKYNAVAADWESGAIAWAANKNGTKLLILRGVSDLVDEEEGEAYGDYELFTQRTREIMKRLIEQLPKWLTGIEKVRQGYRV